MIPFCERGSTLSEAFRLQITGLYLVEIVKVTVCKEYVT